MELIRREEVPEELTWDLSAIYEDEEQMYAELNETVALSREIESHFKGKLTTPEVINDCLDAYRKFFHKNIDYLKKP